MDIATVNRKREETEISVIIPSRNEEDNINKCIESIKITFGSYKYEIIVVDNNSSDRTVEIAKSHNCKIVNNTKMGPAATRNSGAVSAKGKYIAFVDADCILDKNWFKSLKEHFIDKTVVAAGTKISPDFNNATWVENASFWLRARRGSSISKGVQKVRWIGSSNMLIVKSVFEKCNGFNEKLTVAEDYDLCEKLTKLGDIILDKRLYTIHLRESKTLREHFYRELWRGQNSLSHWVNSGLSLYEAPSVMLPILFLFLSFLSFFFLMYHAELGIAVFIIAMCCPLIRVAQSKSAFATPLRFLQCMVVTSTYLLARSVASLKEFFQYLSV